MERLAQLQERIDSINDLRDVVSAIRSLAAVRLRQAGDGLSGARAYAEVVGTALSEALELADPETVSGSPRKDGLGLLLFCSEHGFVGALNEVLLDSAGKILGSGDSLFIVGGRGDATARQRGLPVAWSMPMTSHCDGVRSLARRIARELFGRFARGSLTRLDMMYPRTGRAGTWEICQRALLPLDPSDFPGSPTAIPPRHNLPTADLIEKVVEAYTLAQLAQGALEALAGENAARFAAMSAARQNIDRRLDALGRLEQRIRQEEITTELLDVITGAQAVLEN